MTFVGVVVISLRLQNKNDRAVAPIQRRTRKKIGLPKLRVRLDPYWAYQIQLTK